MTLSSLTKSEAATRSALLEVQRYDIEVDMTGLLEGEVWASLSTISFTCSEPGATTFVDVAMDVARATLNGEEVDVSAAADGRLPLPALAADNVLVVEASTTNTGTGEGVLRTVDPTDKLVYVWTSLEPDEARRVWACFDQPDLKAPHRFVVTAPSSWLVTSNGAPESVVDVDDADARVWTYPDTPRLSTYVVVVNAGPFHEVRRRHDGYDLGFYCRQSLVPVLERDLEELVTLARQGLAFFGERFSFPFPQERYDQVFVPNLGGAMENWGCVTYGDGQLFRTPPTHAQRAVRAEFIFHEMAHMWFGDLVTMQWWDDLWLNEAFASWAANWGMAGASAFTDQWATFLAASKRTAYEMDMSPARHPIRSDVPDVSTAMSNFDAITYVKGQSVLHQLVAFIGEDAFVAGLRDYFSRYAFTNTRLDDLMDCYSRASGRDLSAWTKAGLDEAGTDVISLVGDELVADEGDDVGASLVEPGLRPRGQVATRRPRVAVHQVVEPGVGERVAAEVVTQPRHEGVLADEGDQLVQDALPLDVGDRVEVRHRRGDVGDVAADRVARRAHVHLVGGALGRRQEGRPLVGERTGTRHAPVGRPRREGLVEPEVVPPLHRHQVAEPHVGHLVEDELGPYGTLRVGRGSAEQLAVAVGHAAPVLHRAAEVGHEDLVVALLRERAREPLAEEREALAGEGDQLVEVPLEDRYERLAAVEPEVVAVVLATYLVERARVDHDDVRRQGRGVGVGPDLRVGGLGGLDRLGRAVGRDHPRRRCGHHEAVGRLEVGLVEAGPHPPGLVGLQAGPDVDELVGRVDRAEDALTGAGVGGAGLDHEDVVGGQRRQWQTAVGGLRDVDVLAVERGAGDVHGDVDEGGRAGLAAGEGDRADRGEDLALEQPGHVDRDVVALHVEEGRAGRCFVLGEGRQRHAPDRTDPVHPR